MQDYAALMACFRSGQMNARQLQQHMAGDTDFAAFVEKFTGVGDDSHTMIADKSYLSLEIEGLT